MSTRYYKSSLGCETIPIYMKKVAAILYLGALTTAAFGQGLVNFGNGPTTLISPAPSGPLGALAGSYYFGLLTSSAASGPFTFTGVYGTNSSVPGRIAAYTTSVPGWGPQTTMFYEVVGWSASLGQAFDAAWLTGNFGVRSGFFGISSVASGVAGGGVPVPTPAWNLFGGTGLTGFNLNPVLVPEPTSLVLACLGVAPFLFRRLNHY